GGRPVLAGRADADPVGVALEFVDAQGGLALLRALGEGDVDLLGLLGDIDLVGALVDRAAPGEGEVGALEDQPRALEHSLRELLPVGLDGGEPPGALETGVLLLVLVRGGGAPQQGGQQQRLHSGPPWKGIGRAVKIPGGGRREKVGRRRRPSVGRATWFAAGLLRSYTG